MSHTVKVQTSITDINVLESVCKRLGISYRKGNVSVSLFSSKEQGVFAFRPKGWKYEVVVKEDGTLAYDNYQGSWGKQDALDIIKREYSKEKIIGEYRKAGYRVAEEYQDGEDVVIVLHEGM